MAEREGCSAHLIDDGRDIRLEWLAGAATIGLTAGASAPEVLVREVVDQLKRRYNVHEEPVEGVKEAMVFKLPAGLRAA